jgi:hypothetical protein
MADTYSSTLGWLVMGIGGDNNTWGTNLNGSVFQIFEDAIAGIGAFNVTGGTLDLSTNAPPAGPSAARFSQLIFNGTLTADQTVIVPALSKIGVVVNNCVLNGHSLFMKTPGGTPAAIPADVHAQVIIGGQVNLSPFSWAQVRMPNGAAAAPSYTFDAERGSGWYRAGSQDVRLAINGADVLQVTGAGAGTPSVVNVLSPNALEVNGASVIQAWIAAGGSADAITATFNPAIAALTDGLIAGVRAAAANATTTPTFAPNGLTAHTITKSGGVALVPGDIAGSGHELLLRYNLAGTRWELLNPAFPVQPPIAKPQGRLTLVSGTPVMNADAIGATAVLYTPYEGNLCPVYSGALFINQTFSEQTLSLVANHVANNIYDVFAFLNNGVFTIGTGPAWSNSAAGAGARGSGAGTTQLARLNGLLTNAVQITARNGATTYTVPANQGTYLGSIYIDGTAGQVTCHFGFGQSRKFGVWNAYNRVPIMLKAGAAGTFGIPQQGTLAIWAANVSNTVFAGLAEEEFDNAGALAGLNANVSSAGPSSAIGWNSTSAASGVQGVGVGATGSLQLSCNMTMRYVAPPSLGINTVNGLANVPSGGWNTSLSGEQGNLLISGWRG